MRASAATADRQAGGGADPPCSSVRFRRCSPYLAAALEVDLSGGKQRPETLQAFGNVHTHPQMYFHHRKDGKQKTVYLGKTDAPEIKLAQIKGGIGG